jgi:hypothetical protein
MMAFSVFSRVLGMAHSEKAAKAAGLGEEHSRRQARALPPVGRDGRKAMGSSGGRWVDVDPRPGLDPGVDGAALEHPPGTDAPGREAILAHEGVNVRAGFPEIPHDLREGEEAAEDGDK